MGEEWRRGWHPERIAAKGSDDRVLIVGAGPAGLECARALAQRGYEATLADAQRELGGRLLFETSLPGLSAWRRVLDYRLGQLKTAPNAALYPESSVSAEQVLEFGFERVVLATGSRWTKELYSTMEIPAGHLDGPGVYTPDDIAAGTQLEGPIAVFDFDSYYMGGCLAELLAERHGATTYVTPAGHASDWTILSNELPLVHQALARRGVAIRTLTRVTGFDGQSLQLADLFTGAASALPCRSLVVVGMRRSDDALYRALAARPDDLHHAGIRSIERIGDALAPGAIVHAVHSGHGYARALDGAASERPYRLDSPIVSEAPADAPELVLVSSRRSGAP
jgi:dimethylamine/trimethylamine dehydrogenase